LNALLDKEPDNAMALYDKGTALFLANELTSSVELLERTVGLLEKIEENHQKALVLNMLAKVRLKRGELLAAEESVNLAISFDPMTSFLYYTLGEILMKGNRFDEAFQALKQAAALEPEDLETKYRLAIVCHKLGDYDEGIKILTELEKKVSTDPEITFNLGSFYFKRGNEDKARRKWLEVISAFPDSRFAALARQWTNGVKLAATSVTNDSFGLALVVPETWFCEQETIGADRAIWYFSRPVLDTDEKSIVRPTLAVIAQAMNDNAGAESLEKEWSSLVALGGAEYRAENVSNIESPKGFSWEYRNVVEEKEYRGLIAVFSEGGHGLVIWLNASAGAFPAVSGDFARILSSLKLAKPGAKAKSTSKSKVPSDAKLSPSSVPMTREDTLSVETILEKGGR
jgi:tetratricopeptide (TPR) repeat protein